MKFKIKHLFLSLGTLIAVLFLSFGQLNQVVAQDKKQVMTTFYPVYYLAQRIGGDAVDVEMLLKGNQSAHDYEVSAKDAARTQAVDLFIYQDDEMEYFVSSLLTLIDSKQIQILESTATIDLLSGDSHAEDEHTEEDHAEESDHDHAHDFDPHTWLDPMVYGQQATNVKEALIQLDPANQAVFEANAEQLIKELTLLNEEYETQLSALDNRQIVVQHAAFGYLTHAYDLEQVAIAGISSTQEPSAKELAQMQKFIQEEQVTVIFVEPSLDSAIAKTVSSSNDVELRPLRTLEFVSTQEQSQGVDYFSIMRDNLLELTRD